MKLKNAVRKLERNGYEVTEISDDSEVIAKRKNSRDISLLVDSKGEEVMGIKIGIRYYLTLKSAIDESTKFSKYL